MGSGFFPPGARLPGWSNTCTPPYLTRYFSSLTSSGPFQSRWVTSGFEAKARSSSRLPERNTADQPWKRPTASAIPR